MLQKYSYQRGLGNGLMNPLFHSKVIRGFQHFRLKTRTVVAENSVHLTLRFRGAEQGRVHGQVSAFRMAAHQKPSGNRNSCMAQVFRGLHLGRDRADKSQIEVLFPSYIVGVCPRKAT